DGSAKCKGWILSNIVVGTGVGHFDGTGSDGVCRLESRNKFAGRKDLDGELAIGGLLHAVGNFTGGAEDDVEVLGKGRCQPPGDLWPVLCDGGRCKRGGDGGSSAGHGCLPQEVSAVHGSLLIL